MIETVALAVLAYAVGCARGRNAERATQHRINDAYRRPRWIEQGRRLEARARTTHPTVKHFDADPEPRLVVGPNTNVVPFPRRRGGPQSVA